MKCPRCQTGITSSPDAAGFLSCPGCGARLRKNSAAGAAPRRASPLAGSPVEIDGMLTRLDAPELGGANPSLTLPPGTPLPRIPRAEPGPRAVPDPGSSLPGMARAAAAAAVSGPRPVPRPVPAPLEGGGASAMDTLLGEVRAVRQMQEQVLELLRDRRPGTSAFEGGIGMSFDLGDDPPAPSPGVPVVRSRRRKSALVIDDDAASCAALVSALEHGDIPVRSVADGNRALAAIAEEKPDVIALELDIAGAMGGKDVVNVIKATMEWVDVPIILYTRVPVENQKEARTIHGADDYVLKGDGAPAALVAKAISFFRKG